METVTSQLISRKMEMDEIEKSIARLDKDIPSYFKDATLSQHDITIENLTQTLDNIDGRMGKISKSHKQIQEWTTQLTKYELDSDDIARQMDEIESRIDKVKEIQNNANKEYIPNQAHNTAELKSDITNEEHARKRESEFGNDFQSSIPKSRPIATFMNTYDIHDDANSRHPI